MTETSIRPDAPNIAGTSFEKLINLDADLVRCPFPAYADLREEGPVAWSDRLSSWIFTRYSDIRAVVGDPETFSSCQASGGTSVTSLARRVLAGDEFSEHTKRQAARRLERSESPALLTCDPPHHKRQRRLVQAAFTWRRVTEMEERIEGIAHQLIDTFAQRGTVDLVREFTMPLPMTVIAAMLGVPSERMHEFKQWSDAFTKGVGSMDLTVNQIAVLFQSVDDFYEYFAAQLEQRRSETGDDLLSGLVEARIDGDQPLTTDECLQMIVQFLVGGNETTTNLLGSTAIRLIEDDALMRSVRADPGRIPVLVEEVLRLHSPVQGLFRVATADTEIAGRTIRAGEMVYVCYGAGNHDGDQYDDPDTLDLERGRVTGHLAFGHGEHACLGANLARAESRIALSALLGRLEDIEMSDDGELPRHASFVLHGPASLPIRFRCADV